ncbi:diacylglycerol/lipid kinase family protein [Candidatus Magnetomonas plexicatena]|uniref:diacylglycerol/lipid kinase family protein n=1 Tax=Candidatus Magnetomonas plexicatena TaxID=2552947 RepID=UPI001C790C47|nr:diacylglycerol kinase family lipid kinase [Nitrospirales bacterium LBB_01]
MKSRALVIVNPIAGSYTKEKYNSLCTALTNGGMEFDVFFTDKKGDAEAQTHTAIKEQTHSLILVCGGDGTANEVVNAAAFSDIPVGFLPFGLTNVICREIGTQKPIPEAAKIILNGTVKSAALGKVTSIETEKHRYFISMAGFGFDGKAVFGLNRRLKKRFGIWAYIFSGLQSFLNYVPVDIGLTVEDFVYEATSVIVSNGSRYGGDFKIAPNADITNDTLYASIFNERTRMEIIRDVISIIRGQSCRCRHIKHIQCQHVTIDNGVHAQIDGDYLGKGSWTVETVGNALQVIY